MLKKRFKLNSALMGTLAVFTIIALLPLSAHSLTLGNNRWIIDGFVRNNTGVWLENWDTSENNDSLATCRNWFRLNLNGKLSRNMRVKAEVLAVYEPEYSRELHGTEGDGTPIAANEYNYFDFRELRLDMRVGRGHELRFGRQIVNWGESISARVGDVINPVDGRFDLGFTNLEDTRMPIWMIRGLHQFSTKNRAIALDWAWAPYLQTDRYRVSRTPSNIFHTFTNGDSTPGVRFGAMPESYSHMLNETGLPALVTVPGMSLPANAVPGIPISGAPFNNMWQYVPAGVWPTVLGPETFPGAYQTGLNFLLPATSFFDPNAQPTDYPDASLADARWGFKLSTTVAGMQTGFYYWDHNTYDGIFRLEGLGAPIPGIADFGTLNVRLVFPREKIYGFFANKNFSFGVLRMDVAYRPDRDYNTLKRYDFLSTVLGFDVDPTTPNTGTGIVEKDTWRVQFGINKDFMFYSLNETASFGLTAEYVGDFIIDGEDDNVSIPSYYLPVDDASHTIMVSFGTNYGFGKYSYDITALHNFSYGGNGLIQPSFTFAPSWMNNKWNFKLAYSCLYGPDYSYVYGLLKEKDMVVLTTQFSF